MATSLIVVWIGKGKMWRINNSLSGDPLVSRTKQICPEYNHIRWYCINNVLPPDHKERCHQVLRTPGSNYGPTLVYRLRYLLTL